MTKNKILELNQTLWIKIPFLNETIATIVNQIRGNILKLQNWKKTEQNLAIVSKTNILNQKQIIGSKIEIIEWKNNSWLKVMSELNIKIKLLNKNRNIGYKYTRNKFSLTSAGILGPELWLVNVLRADISSYIFDWKLVQFFYP